MIIPKLLNRNWFVQFLQYFLILSIIFVFGLFLGRTFKECDANNTLCPSSFPANTSSSLPVPPNKEISEIYSFEYSNNFFIDYRDYEFVSITNKMWQGEKMHYPVIAVRQYLASIPDDMDLIKWLEGVGDPTAPIVDKPVKSCREFILNLRTKMQNFGLEGNDCIYYGVSDIQIFQVRNLPAITFKTQNVTESGTHTLVRYKNSADVTILVDIYKTVTGMVDDKAYVDSQIEETYQGILNTLVFKTSEDQQKSNIPVKLYYYNTKADLKSNCSNDSVLPVERVINASGTPIQDTIALLVEGKITEAEKIQGFSSEFPHEGFKLLGAKLEKGVLTLDFPVIPSFTSGGSCRVGLLVSQIEKTAKQFPEVKEVKYTQEALFQP